MPFSSTVAIFNRFFQSVQEDGFQITYKRILRKLRSKYGSKKFKKSWKIAKKDRYNQEKESFDSGVLISILVPVYNTPHRYLNDMLDSVQAQTCKRFELCITDGSDDQHGYVGEIITKRALDDNRIRYVKLSENKGISENTNACISMAAGSYFMLLDHDDVLHPSALYEIMSVIEQSGADFVYTDEATFYKHPKDAYLPHFKQDYSPDTLRAHNYICHISVFSRTLYEKAGCFRSEYDGSQDYDMILRLTENANKIVHIPKILYYWRSHPSSVASNMSAKPYAIANAKAAIADHLRRVGLSGTVMDSLIPSIYRIDYTLKESALVSIIIPSCDHIDHLQKCINSILEKTDYSSYEIIIVENNSKEQRTFDYYEALKSHASIRVLFWSKSFNYAAINNFAASHANGKYLLFLNNDVEVINPGWMKEMLMFAQRPDVGAVGAKLYYPNGCIQHAGVGIGVLTLAGHYHKGFPKNAYGYMGRLQYQQNVSAVTGACLMISARMYQELNGMEEALAVNFNDVDLCLRLREKNLLIVFTPFAELFHHESLSRGLDKTHEQRERYLQEVSFFRSRWADQLENGDPYFNKNFDPLREDFSYL